MPGRSNRLSPGSPAAYVKKDQINKNVGHWVRLIPIAHRLDARGYPLPQIDDEWRIDSVNDDGARIFLPRTGHARTLGFDHIHHYTSDRVERGMNYGFLTLNVQLAIQGNSVHVTPTRPGEALPPRIPPDPIRQTLLQRLHDSPTRFVQAGELTEFPIQEVVNEIARCDAEGLLEARLLRGGTGILDAVALRLKPRGVEWLRSQGSY